MMPPVPGFGGGGLPGAGVADPLSALGGLGPPAPDDGLTVTDDPAAADSDASGDEPQLRDDPLAPIGEDPGSVEDASDTTEPGTVPASAAEGEVEQAGTDSGVRLPDGTTVQAPTEQAASAVRAALGGASVADAYEQAGITVPPAGTPVLEPVAPGELRTGDVGVWKDHLVMALGDGKVLVSGQVQPQSSVGRVGLSGLDASGRGHSPVGSAAAGRAGLRGPMC